jgi:hypothetical protein
LPENRRATGEIKDRVPYISPSAGTPENEEKVNLDNDVPIADKLSETELDTALNEMFARTAKGLE